ncbi:MAG: helix-turn-helix transcriptional regulator [Bdellovibrionales bacterium]|nr:helix-turn-helix transcriptional regulator [Bdellovibrionales bacterium]
MEVADCTTLHPMQPRKKRVKLRLDVVLKEKGVSKYKFSKLLNKSTSNVAVYFRKDYNPNLSTLVRWAEVLDCRVRDLIDED